MSEIHSCNGGVIKALESQNESFRKEVSDLKSLIARERDRFAKLECDLLAKLAAEQKRLLYAKEALEDIVANASGGCTNSHDAVAQEALAKLDEAK